MRFPPKSAPTRCSSRPFGAERPQPRIHGLAGVLHANTGRHNHGSARARVLGNHLLASGLVLGGLEVLDAEVKGGDDLGLLDAEAGGGGDVHGAVLAHGGVLAAHAAHAEPELLGDRLGGGLIGALLGQGGEGNVHGGAHASAEVGGARGYVAIVLGVGEGEAGEGLHGVEALAEAVEHVVEDGALGHAHDAEVVLLAHPHDEPTVRGHVAAAAEGPVVSNAGRGEVLVGGHVLEHEVVRHQLLVLGIGDGVLGAGGQRVVGATELGVLHEDLEGARHLLLQVDALLLGHGAGEGEGRKVAADAHAHGEGGEAELGEVELAVGGHALHLGEVPVGDMVHLRLDFVVIADHAVHVRLEEVVVVGLHGVGAHARVGVLRARLEHHEVAALELVGERGVVVHVEVLGREVVGVGLLHLHDEVHEALGGRDVALVLGDIVRAVANEASDGSNPSLHHVVGLALHGSSLGGHVGVARGAGRLAGGVEGAEGHCAIWMGLGLTFDV
mmetsp:Transcript_5562/g.18786  ORF Transcript_5562/g.18786 Transcript_5562/m.18786 type:complete len:500 (-) Transcript_5562:21-1520(-)